MSCNTCGSSSPYSAINNYVLKVEKKNISCDYNMEDVAFIKQVLIRVINEGSLHTATTNSYLGIIKSIENSPDYICSFKQNLDNIFAVLNKFI
ncbi:hypothetical protein [Leptolyngbya phage Lbo-JY46]